MGPRRYGKGSSDGGHALERSARRGKWSQEAGGAPVRAEKILAARPRSSASSPCRKALRHRVRVLIGGKWPSASSTGPIERRDAGHPLGGHGGQPEKAGRSRRRRSRPDGARHPRSGHRRGRADRSHRVHAEITAHAVPGPEGDPRKAVPLRFGLSPAQEARAFSRTWRGRGFPTFSCSTGERLRDGFATAAAAAAREAGIRIARPCRIPETQDFTETIKRGVGNATFQRQSRSKEKGQAMKLPLGVSSSPTGGTGLPPCVAVALLQRLSPVGRVLRVERPELLRKAVGSVSGAVFPVDYST